MLKRSKTDNILVDTYVHKRRRRNEYL